jgi:hypothetical protein
MAGYDFPIHPIAWTGGGTGNDFNLDRDLSLPLKSLIGGSSASDSIRIEIFNSATSDFLLITITMLKLLMGKLTPPNQTPTLLWGDR